MKNIATDSNLEDIWSVCINEVMIGVQMEKKAQTKKSVSMMNKSFKALLNCKRNSIVAGLSISLLIFSSVDALNIGEARSQSYLGQPLSIFVPVTDESEIVDINQLVIGQPNTAQLRELNVNTQTSNLAYQVISNGVEKGILITTSTPFNEPFIDVGVKVDYKGVSKLRKLTALIDLQPLTGSNTEVGTPLVAQTGNSSSELVSNSSSAGSNTSGQDNNANSGLVTYSSELMGPYDWAQAGVIPEKFGPVLEGQSLWRVARRINESMNVSIDQMMWALFRENPQAFSTDNVNSLQSGSILTIPEESFVREVTELGAVRLLSAQSSETNTNAEQQYVVDDESSDPVVSIEESTAVSNTLQVEQAANSSFNETARTESNQNDVTTDTTTNELNDGSSSVVSLSELDIVEELRNEISYLNKQLIAQQERIQTLEQSLAIAQALNNTVDSESSDVTSNLEATVSELNSENPTEETASSLENAPVIVDQPSIINERLEQPVDNSSIIEQPVDNSSIIEQSVVDASSIVEASPVVSEPSSSSQTTEAEPTFAATATSEKSNTSLTSWIFGGLVLLLLGVAFIARNRLIPAVLKLFGNKYEYEEDSSVFGSITEKRITRRDLSELTTPDVASRHVDPDVISTTNNNKDEFEDFEDYSFFVDDEELMDVEELSFPDRIKQLIDSGDYDEAKKTVSFATVANVDEHDINIYMLKIFAAESDRESFDKLFDKVHANIDEYDAESQLVIAELQSEMAIGKVINFGSDQIAS